MNINLFGMITDWARTGAFFTAYGWFHLMWLGIMIVATIILCSTLAKRHDPLTDDGVMLFFGSMLVIIELYKQFFYLIKYGWRYDFSNVPFQFCDVPSWVMLLIPFLKDGKVKDACYRFLAFFGLLAGATAMLYPNDVFCTKYITMLIHTMLWHASMVVVGIYTILAKGYGKNYVKEVIPGFVPFLCAMCIAVLLNETVGQTVNGSFNLFYISSRFGSHLPVFSSIYSGSEGTFRWVLLLVAYFTGFSIGASLLFFIAKGVQILSSSLKKLIPAHK